VTNFNDNGSNHPMNTVCISTKMSTPEKAGGSNTGRPLHFKK